MISSVRVLLLTVCIKPCRASSMTILSTNDNPAYGLSKAPEPQCTADPCDETVYELV